MSQPDCKRGLASAPGRNEDWAQMGARFDVLQSRAEAAEAAEATASLAALAAELPAHLHAMRQLSSDGVAEVVRAGRSPAVRLTDLPVAEFGEWQRLLSWAMHAGCRLASSDQHVRLCFLVEKAREHSAYAPPTYQHVDVHSEMSLQW